MKCMSSTPQRLVWQVLGKDRTAKPAGEPLKKEARNDRVRIQVGCRHEPIHVEIQQVALVRRTSNGNRQYHRQTHECVHCGCTETAEWSESHHPGQDARSSTPRTCWMVKTTCPICENPWIVIELANRYWWRHTGCDYTSRVELEQILGTGVSRSPIKRWF